MKIKLIILFLLMAPCVLNAQDTTQGIHFKKQLDWVQVKQMAKAQNKFIFVDCYATWCGPCRQMDNLVYTDPGVGKIYDSLFVSVKIQIDRTSNDSEWIKAWYATAGEFASGYSINAFPSFLFFSPEGIPVHKAVGTMPVSGFIQLAKDAINPDKQYYRIKNEYAAGRIGSSVLKDIATSMRLTDNSLAGKMAVDYLRSIKYDQWLTGDDIRFISAFKANYDVKKLVVNAIDNEDLDHSLLTQSAELLNIFKQDPAIQKHVGEYLSTLNTKRIWEKGNLILLKDFSNLISPGDRYFHLFYMNSHQADTIIGKPGFAMSVVDAVLYNKLINPALLKADSLRNDPNWQEIFMLIKAKTDTTCANRNIITAKVQFYQSETAKAEKAGSEEKWKWGKEYADAVAIQLERYGFDRTGGISTGLTGNTIEFSIYRYCNDAKILNEALDWMDTVLRYYPGRGLSYVYGGILYRLGKTDAAKGWQNMTLQLIREDDLRNNKNPMADVEYIMQNEILTKMKKMQTGRDLIYWSN